MVVGISPAGVGPRVVPGDRQMQLLNRGVVTTGGTVTLEGVVVMVVVRYLLS